MASSYQVFSGEDEIGVRWSSAFPFTGKLFRVLRWNQLKCVSEWMEKCEKYLTMECCSAIKKDGILSFTATWVSLEDIVLNK